LIKRIVYLLLAMTALAAVSPWLSGRLIEKGYHATLQQMADESGLQVTPLTYQRGWFTTEASSQITLPSGNGKILSLLLHHHIRHGLLTFDDENRPHLALGLVSHTIELPKESSSRWQQLFGNGQAVTVRTVVGLDGSQQWRISGEAVSYQQGAEHLLIRPLTLALRISGDLQRIEGKLHWEGMQGANEQGEGEIAPVDCRFDMQRLRPYVWSGDYDWRQGAIRFNNEQSYLLISGLTLSNKTRSDNRQRLSSEQSALVETFDLSGKRYGPGKLEIAISNIPEQVVAHIARIQRQAAAGAYGSDQPAAEMALQQLAMEALGELPILIAADPAIEVSELSLQTPRGPIKGKFHFSIRDLSPADAMNLPLIKQHAHMQLELQLPAALLDPQDPQLSSLLAQGLLRQEGDMLVTHARMENGELVVNDRAVPLRF